MRSKSRLYKWSVLAVVFSGLTCLFLYWLINYQPTLIPSFIVQQARQPDLMKYPEARRCAECHQDIFEAWKKSRHSVAWVSKNYIKDSEDRTKEKCLPCHIPTVVVPGVKPDPRLHQRDDGIFCVPCHVRDQVMNGPYDLFSPPHPTRKNDDYRLSKFCSTCHQKTFKEWRTTGSNQSCQSCHMKRGEGRLTQKFPLSLLHAKKEVADHSFPKGDLKKENLFIQSSFHKATLLIRLVNTTIPHRVPTADNGDPRLYVSVTFLDAAGNQVERDSAILSPQQDTALSFQKPKDLEFFAPSETQSAQIDVRYKPAWSKEKSDVTHLTVTR